MREQDIALRSVAALDHHVDHIAGLHRDVAGGVGELRQRRNSIRFMAYIDEYIVTGDFEDPALKHFVPGRRRKVAVILKEMLVLVRVHHADRRFEWSGHIVLRQRSSSRGNTNAGSFQL